MTDLADRRIRLVLIAHDGCKTSLVEWAAFNRDTLAAFDLTATAGTLSAASQRPRRLCCVGAPASGLLPL